MNGRDRHRQITAGPLAAALQRGTRLTRKQEHDLIARAQRGDAQARERLIECNLRLVLYVAGRYQTSSLSLEDLVLEGVVGLVDAIERYDPSHGNGFSAYAVPWLRLRIGRSVYRMNRLIRLPERNERLLARYREMCDESVDGNLTVEEAAQRLQAPPEVLRAVVEASHPIMSMGGVDEGDGRAPEEVVACEDSDPWLEICRRDERLTLHQALEALRPGYRQVLNESFGLDGAEPLSLNEIARRWGVTKQAVSAFRRRALMALRQQLACSRAVAEAELAY